MGKSIEKRSHHRSWRLMTIIQPSRNDIERKLAAVWSEILGLEKEKISIDAHFFHLGGHSLKATLLAARINKKFNAEIPLGEIFKTPHIRGLAAYTREAAKMTHVPVEPVEKKDYYPSSSAQKRLFFLGHVENIGIAYNMPNALNAVGNIDKPRFERAVKDLIKRHEVLRTSFHLIDDEQVQRIHDEVEFEIEYHDLSTDYTDYTDYTDDKDDNIHHSSFIARHFIHPFIRPFDLSRAPLLRVLPGDPGRRPIPAVIRYTPYYWGRYFKQAFG